MTDWKEFISCDRGLLIAPAGHGKTTAIADCIMQCPDNSCQLVLTHTHAGIASLRNKFRQKNIPSSRYQLDTITGFAQRYVLSFFRASDLPDEDDDHYFDVVIEKCRLLMQSRLVQNVIKASYDGIFVDEYQDCTLDQHKMILKLAANIPLHLLGDPLQGIFSFGDRPLVNFNRDLCQFKPFDLLDHPWRWEKSNPDLGRFILNIRKDIEANRTIDLLTQRYEGVTVGICQDNDNEKYSCLREKIQELHSDNILVICPSYIEYNQGVPVLKGSTSDRINIKQRVDYYNRFSILDAIDSPEYYKCAKMIDEYIEKCLKRNRIKKIAWLYDILADLHLSKTEIGKWIIRKENRFAIRKKESRHLSDDLKESFGDYMSDVCLSNLNKVITKIRALPNVKCYHREFYRAIERCFNIAIMNDISMFEAMKLFKTRLRHQGRKVDGCYFGTTLLTKGLEFDTVIVWNADKFDAKNFYVAISRACKKLIIISETSSLKFENKY